MAEKEPLIGKSRKGVVVECPMCGYEQEGQSIGTGDFCKETCIKCETEYKVKRIII